jgi:hypothetical protein
VKNPLGPAMLRAKDAEWWNGLPLFQPMITKTKVIPDVEPELYSEVPQMRISRGGVGASTECCARPALKM